MTYPCGKYNKKCKRKTLSVAINAINGTILNVPTLVIENLYN